MEKAYSDVSSFFSGDFSVVPPLKWPFYSRGISLFPRWIETTAWCL